MFTYSFFLTLSLLNTVISQEFNDFSFGVWDKIKIKEYQEYRYGFPKDFSWYHLVPTRFPSQRNMEKIKPKIRTYIQRRAISFNMTEKLEKILFHSNNIKVVSAADYLCIFADNHLYLCEWLDFRTLFELVPVFFPDGIDQVRVAYIYAACYFHEIKRIYGEQTRDIRFNTDLCPNPCKRNPCVKHQRYTYSDRCEILSPDRISYVTNYKCMCKDQYEWDEVRLECKPKNLCYLNTYCGGFTKSIHCEMIDRSYDELDVGFDDFEVRCVCRREYMGPQCNRTRDPCIINFFSEYPSGNQACGEHGKCVPTMGTNEYTCECERGFEDDPSSPYLDCRALVDPCRALKCYKGFCKMSSDRKHAECICNDGYEGVNCDVLSPQWLQWRQWTACEPSCGLQRRRHRNRTCSDSANLFICYEKGYSANVEYETCIQRPCKLLGNFTQWTRWSICQKSCSVKDGHSYRTRQCFYSLGENLYAQSMKVDCIGKTIEHRDCPIAVHCDFIMPIIVSTITSLAIYSLTVIIAKVYLIKLHKNVSTFIEQIRHKKEKNKVISKK